MPSLTAVSVKSKQKNTNGELKLRKTVSEKKVELLQNFKVFVPGESKKLVAEVLDSGWIGGDGPKVKEFEKQLSVITQNNNVLAVNSGTSALHLALRLAGVRGGEVVTTPMTCFATNAPIVNEGATPVWADIDPETGNIDPYEIAKHITKKTRAIMVVHWGGSPADVEFINKIASIYNIPVIEDAAQALGSEFGGKPIGSHSDFVTFSFQAIKIVNTADGGLLATRKKDDAKRAKILRWYGIDRDERKWDERYFFWEYPISEAGYKFQMNDVSAAIGLGQLPYLQKFLDHRRKVAKIYEKALRKSRSVKAQKVLPKAKSNYWLFTVICESQTVKAKLWEKLNKIGVKSEEAHRRNDLYPVFAPYKKEELPGVKHFNDNHLIIPVGHWVSEENAREIARVLAKF